MKTYATRPERALGDVASPVLRTGSCRIVR